MAVASFIKNAILRSGAYDLKLISLATSAREASHLCLTRPASWLRGATIFRGMWEGLPFVHVGAVAGELEFQRYRPRRALAEAVAECDILQVVCGSPAWANAVCGLGKPVAAQVATRVKIERRRRDANPQGLADWWRKASTVITDRMDDRALRAVDAIQVENTWMLEYARRLNIGREVDLRYAPPGVDNTMFNPLRERLSNDDTYILCVGRLDDPRKNIGLLLEAYARMPALLQQRVRLVLAGSSGPPASFWQRAAAFGLHNQISYTAPPERQALVELYQKATAFALPSDEEGLGVVLLEAMACGVPVVSTRSGGPDGIVTDGEDGFLVALDDANALADRLKRLCSDRALNIRVGRRARVTIERRFADVVAAEVFVDMWDRMLFKPKKPMVTTHISPAGQESSSRG